MMPPLAALLLALCLAPATVQDELRFKAHGGLALQRQIELSQESQLMSMRVSANGIEQATELSMELSHKQTLKIRDSFGNTEQGQPLELIRHFESLESQLHARVSSSVLGPQQIHAEGHSPFLGERVHFNRSGTGAPWRISPSDDSKLDASHLEGLRYDLDLSDLLPTKAVLPGDSWEVPAGLMNALLSPAGDLQLAFETSAESGLRLPPGARMPPLGPLAGRAIATLVGIEDADQGRLARIALELDVGCSQDLTEQMGALLKMSEGPGGIELRCEVHSYSLEWSFKGRGIALWDLQHERLLSLSIEGQHAQTVDSSMAVLASGIEQLISNHMQLNGSLKAKLSISEQ